jgi:DNA invertase Pin-like site-specific DNA recombinase
MSNQMKNVVIYKRTSSLTNCGENKDSHIRQEKTCSDYCKSKKWIVAASFYDEGVSGSIYPFRRDGFMNLYLYCKENDIDTIVFESLSRFSRTQLETELAYRKLRDENFHLVSVVDGNFEDDKISKLNRTILGAIAEYQKEEIKTNLLVSRERKKTFNKSIDYVTLDGDGKCEGRKSHKEINVELVSLVKRLRRKNWKTKRQMSFRKISNHIADLGYYNEKGKVFHPQSIKDMVSQ